MASLLVLTLPIFPELFMLEIDASITLVGVVLSQKGHPRAFFSKKCHLQAFSIYIREMYVITKAIRK